MNTRVRSLALSAALALVAGCDHQPSDGPPALRLGDSLCAQCNMIISDERFATATIIEGPRGPEPRLFDDFNCQVNHEVEHPGQRVLQRWSHDHAHAQWLRTADAHFIIAKNLRTPMASHAAAFATREKAERAAADLDGEAMDFKTAWKRLGFAGACCALGGDDGHDPAQGGDSDEP